MAPLLPEEYKTPYENPEEIRVAVYKSLANRPGMEGLAIHNVMIEHVEGESKYPLLELTLAWNGQRGVVGFHDGGARDDIADNGIDDFATHVADDLLKSYAGE